MMTTWATVACAVLSVSQNLPPELNRQQVMIDPILQSSLRAAVTKASEAELDSRRGVGNALQILRDLRAEQSDPSIRMSVDLRIAATVLRARFLQNPKVAEATRHEQALATFSRLDIKEPGLSAWIGKTLKHHPKVQKIVGQTKVPFAVLTRGQRLDRRKIATRVETLLGKIDVGSRNTPLREARFVLKFGSDEVRDADNKTVIRVVLNMEQNQDGKQIWSQSLFRTSEASTADAAIAANVEWLTRNAARQILFRHLEWAGLESVMFGPPINDDGHGHGQRRPDTVRIPKNTGSEPVVPKHDRH